MLLNNHSIRLNGCPNKLNIESRITLILHLLAPWMQDKLAKQEPKLKIQLPIK